ncbi:MAG: [protein-PII] uridylyltransferase [Pseudomonadales bacterium]|nr:[protein-PII] uridylyltransferase [Pseudomonadales bacterium]
MKKKKPDPSPVDVAGLKRRIARAEDVLAKRFWEGEDAETLVRERSGFIDAFLAEIWQHWFEYKQDVALLAIGGYGRGELHPYSDIDLLILVKNVRLKDSDIEQFVQLLWDLKLDIGHSVRTISECRSEASKNASVVTSLYERRYLAGSQALASKLNRFLDRKNFWPSSRFFEAKSAEQSDRHARFNHVEYDLEPNIKGSPGGLRDIQTISWIAQRHLETSRLTELIRLGFLTKLECDWLEDGRRFLWMVRFGLHLLAARGEDRLLFHHQRELAKRFGYVDSEGMLAVEIFMNDYYRHVLELREVNDILFQHFEEAIAQSARRPKIEVVNPRFQIHNDYIEVTSDDVFTMHPPALIEIFVIMANRTDIAGVRATTIRLIRRHLDLIDNDFRRNPQVTSLFIALLRAPYTLVSQLTRMRRYGVLGRYIPEFGQVIGQMQHDLFHIYTVDAHTMMVIRNMRRFHQGTTRDDFPVAWRTANNLPKIELLYIAGLFHDIGKGRGGDHSALGSIDVTEFCQRHKLPPGDVELVAWLVSNHLDMSTTAQRKDIHDPEVVIEFAQKVASEERLDYLYTLTVADITATNPTLWNSWRATLMRRLYFETKKALQRGFSNPAMRIDYINDRKATAYSVLAEQGMAAGKAESIWNDPGHDFFLRHSGVQIAHITNEIGNYDDEQSGPLILVLDIVGEVSAEGATEIFLYCRNRAHLFADSVVTLDHLGLHVVAASIATSASDFCFNSYIVLEDDGTPVRTSERKHEVLERLGDALVRETRPSISPRRKVSQRLKQFVTRTDVLITNPSDSVDSILQIVSSDRQGLLSVIGSLFVDLDIVVHQARITTLGERVEDVFHISDIEGNRILDRARISQIVSSLEQTIDSEITEAVA